jgi:hypothetical protein
MYLENFQCEATTFVYVLTVAAWEVGTPRLLGYKESGSSGASALLIVCKL